MPEPIEYLILRDLQAALQGIDAHDGYHYTLGGLAVKLDADQNVSALLADGVRPFIVLTVDAGQWEYQPASQVVIRLPITVTWVSQTVLHSTDSLPRPDEAKQELFWRGCADIEQAIAKDISRGGRAVDTRIVRRGFRYDVEGEEVWADVELDIRFYRTYGQPNG